MRQAVESGGSRRRTVRRWLRRIAYGYLTMGAIVTLFCLTIGGGWVQVVKTPWALLIYFLGWPYMVVFIIAMSGDR